MAVGEETLEFQAETTRLLDLMIHSLYTNKDIFLRELISNASDALDRLRFESLTKPELLDGSDKLEIRLDIDKNARTLTISDAGIGMSREDVIANIGTIARSCTRELRDRVAGGQSVPELIGEFGVGFYSAFMVSSRVQVLTRRAGEIGATLWESCGNGSYTIRDAEKQRPGTSITLYLMKPEVEIGMDDYADEWRIESIVRRYSDFINYPIVMKHRREDEKDGRTTVTVEDEVLNSMKPIWARRPSEVKDEEYSEFYKHLSHDWTQPLKTIHLKAEGTFEYESLLYIPRRAPYDLYYVAPDVGLQLFAKRVMIEERCKDLLPNYLRFIKGLVDVSDLPLNISRQKLQQDNHIILIRKRLTRKILDAIEGLFEKDKKRYLEFWGEFGRAMKEGAAGDLENRDRLVGMLLFESSNSPDALTTLKEYVARMRTGQEQIFYLTGKSRAIVENSPHLEAVKQEGLEVLYLVDGVDELLLQHLSEFEGKKLKSMGKGVLKLGDEDKLKEPLQQYEGMLSFLQKTLCAQVKEVRLTSRLTNSPICLVVEEHDYSPTLERALQNGASGGLRQRRVLEVNPMHALIEKMHGVYRENPESPMLVNSAEFLYGLAILAEGSELPDPVKFNRIAHEILGQTI